ncbi:hypothetical protein FQA39_LY10852 [Lamprigera yunnana]|nr:hypothetical protein FQA39_LY10852 [Lamprigera yunnana]
MVFVEAVDYVLKKNTAIQSRWSLSIVRKSCEKWIIVKTAFLSGRRCNPVGYLGVNQSKQVDNECADKCGTEAKVSEELLLILYKPCKVDLGQDC